MKFTWLKDTLTRLQVFVWVHRCSRMVEVGLHVWFKVSAFVIFKITILGDELVWFLSLLLLHHRISHFHVFAAELVSGQELHNAGSDRVSQNIGSGTQTVPAPKRKRGLISGRMCGTQETPAVFEGRVILWLFSYHYFVVCQWN